MSKLPEDWEVVKIGDFCDILDNKRIPISSEKRTEIQGDIPYYGANGVQDYINDYIFNETLVLLAEDGGHFNEYQTRPIAYMVHGKSWVNNHTHVLRAKNGENYFLFYSLVHKDITSFINGGTRAKLNRGELVKIPISLPPLEEQKKIADILSTVDQKIAFVEDNISQTQELKKGLMQKLLTEGIGHTEFKDSEIGRIPECWEVLKLKELGSLEGGFAFKSKEYNDQSIGYQVIRMSNINPYGLNLVKDPKYLEFIEKKAEKYILKQEDILITLTGTIGKTDYGNVAYININKPMVLNQRVGRYVPKEGNYNKFFYYLFNYSQFRNKFFEFGKGGTGNQANVGKNDFESISVPCALYEEQKQIADILSTVDQKLEILKDKKESFVELKKGLMQKLLTGEVRV